MKKNKKLRWIPIWTQNVEKNLLVLWILRTITKTTLTKKINSKPNMNMCVFLECVHILQNTYTFLWRSLCGILCGVLGFSETITPIMCACFQECIHVPTCTHSFSCHSFVHQLCAPSLQLVCVKVYRLIC